MARKTETVNPDQGTMLADNHQFGTLQAIDLREPAAATELPAPPAVDGPSVNLVERAKSLDHALMKYSEASRGYGMDRARGIPVRERALNERYGDATTIVAEAARGNADLAMQRAEEEFHRATGMKALIDSGLVSPAKATVLSGKMYESFDKQFRGKQGAGDRKDYRQVHQYVAGTSTRKTPPKIHNSGQEEQFIGHI